MARGLGKKVPAYRLHKPSQRAVVTLSGKDVYLGRYGTEESRAEYDRAIAEWLAKGRPQVEADRSDPTIDDLVFVYWQHAKVYYVKNGVATSEQGCIKQAIRYVRRLYGKT